MIIFDFLVVCGLACLILAVVFMFFAYYLDLV